MGVRLDWGRTSWLARHIHSDRYARLTVTATLASLAEEELRRRIEALGPVVKALALTYDLEKQQKIIVCELNVKKEGLFELSSELK